MVPYPLLGYLVPPQNRAQGGGARMEGMLLPSEDPSYLTWVCSGFRPAPQMLEAGFAGPEACWSELQPEGGLPGPIVLQSRKRRKKWLLWGRIQI